MAAEFATSVASGVAENLVERYVVRPALSNLRYVFCFQNIVEEFNEQKQLLSSAQTRLQNDVAEARRQTLEIEQDVKKWLEEADKVMEEVESLENEIQENKPCLTWCPNWNCRYRLGKKIAKKTPGIAKLVESSKFDPNRIGHRATLPNFLPSKDFVPSESSTSVLNQIWEALKIDSVNMIGVLGMGGVGKTTLVKEVGKKAEELKLFDEVVMTTVSQNVNIDKIQDEIADLLGLEFDKKSEQGKARQLWLRLKNVERILVILDDVWTSINLNDIGIPIGEDHIGCKILLTTRLRQVCSYMSCHPVIDLEVLEEDEAWDLFQKNADLKNDFEGIRLRDVAMEVARECRGLPLAIVTIARALKHKTLDAWIVANKQLRESQHSGNSYENIYTRLKISYDCLTGEKIQSCFLLCSLFPEDYDISIEDLTRFGVGQGLFHDASLIDDARTEMRAKLEDLQNSGLLLDSRKDKCVKMHDVVRDFAHWITSKGEKVFKVNAGLGWKEWPRSESFECFTAISLMNNKIERLPDGLECPKLETLLVGGDGSTKVSGAFFEGMKALKVLTLENVLLSLEGLQGLTNLRNLRLEKCKLENVSSLAKLKKLEILDLRSSHIYELPIELRELRGLRLLDLSTCGMLQRIPINLLTRLESLEELYIDYPSFEQWTTEEKSGEGSNASLSELNLLSHLKALTLCVRSKCLSKHFVFPKLERYAIMVNKWQHDNYPTSKTLKIKESSLDAFKSLLLNVEDLSLDSITGYKNLVPVLDRQGLQKLTFLELQDCKDIECLIDTTQHQSPTTAFSNLEKLSMTKMVSLKQLCNGLPPKEFLQNLKELSIRHCMDMISADPWVQNLRKVTIKDCRQMLVVFEMGKLLHFKQEHDQPQLLSMLTYLELEFLPELLCIWKGQTHHVSLHSLKVVRVQHCDKLTSLFSPFLAQSLIQLEELEILHCPQLKRIIADFEEDDEEISLNSFLHPLCLPKLTTIRIIDCSRLEHVFPMSMAEGLPQLKSLNIIDSSQLEQIFSTVKEKDEKDIVLSQLQSLVLQNLVNLKSFCPENCFVKLPSLVELKMYRCPELTRFTAQLPARTLAQLKELRLFEVGNNSQLYTRVGPQLRQTSSSDSEYLTIGNCQEIFQLQGGDLLLSLETLHLEDLSELQVIWKCPTQVETLQNLTQLMLIDCKSLRYVFPPMLAQHLSHLSYLCVKGCEALEQIIDQDQSSTSSSNAQLQPTISFPSLRKIWIIGCNKLKCLFPISVAHCLLNLEEFKVEGASKLEQIFGHEDETDLKDGKEMVLPQLKRLFLKRLPSLIRFIPECYHFVFPTLEYLEVKECSKITTSFLVHSDSACSMHAQKEFCLFNMRHKNKQCDSIVPQLRQKSPNLEILAAKNHERVFQTEGGYTLSSLRVLRLETLPELCIIWKDPVQNVTLQNLITLKVIHCKSLRHVFSPMIAQSLLHLKYLKIWGCEALEQIVAADQISPSQVLLQACFPNLTRLQIGKCKNLKRLFPASSVGYVSKLRYLIIEEALELEHLFEHEDKASTKYGKSLFVPQLEVLFLGKLPSLLSSIPEGYHFIFQSLRSLTVKECPKITTAFAVDTNLFVHAKTKTSQVVEKETVKTTTAIQRIEDGADRSTSKDIYWYRWYQPNELPPYMEEPGESF
ncbi:probable disease resistance protein At4g27220 [Durio zibethinus]|uniref:Probable disease resistance protein At4g27220 n=1 Tax=Durio zibethinus TaxID=66656 RepID=A0A6P6AP80_DURZI|nr:probable disease resistance protein At4g27220 [Durio zibethinus]XP_022766686.1 probable disease resistance protein At4g27220 [Durio zibethinus]XP_022766687.1 probable disease resistance protein At4g27220 [Durio zibethinus]